MTTSPTLPRALVSTGTLRENAAAAVAAGGQLADLRADALGHGIYDAARVMQDAGVPAVLVDDSDLAVELRDSGIVALTAGEPDIDVVELFGLGTQRPVLELRGHVHSTKRLLAGEAVSYGYTHRATDDTTIALVTGGYAQGIVRSLGNRASAEIAGQLHPIVGRVAMDVCVIDLQDPQSRVQAGDDAVYFGGVGPARTTLASWAELTGLTLAELVTVAGSKAVRTWKR